MFRPGSKVRLITSGRPRLPEVGATGTIELLDPRDDDLDVKVRWDDKDDLSMPWVNHTWIELVEETTAVGTAVLHCRICNETEFSFKDNEGWYVCAKCGAIHDKDEVFSNLQINFD